MSVAVAEAVATRRDSSATPLRALRPPAAPGCSAARSMRLPSSCVAGQRLAAWLRVWAPGGGGRRLRRLSVAVAVSPLQATPPSGLLVVSCSRVDLDLVAVEKASWIPGR